MKIRNILLSTALLALTGCSNDESGGELADGKYPLELRAEGLAVTPATTRATVDGDWEGVTRLAVMVDGVMKEYDVTPDANDKTKATLKAAGEPFYWKSKTEPMTVSAWWRYNDASSGDVTQLPVMRDLNEQYQLSGYRSCDYIYAEPQPVTFDNPALVFKHRTAKIAVTLKSAIGGDLSEDKTVENLKITVGTKNFTPYRPYDDDNTKDKQQYLLLLVPTTEATSIAVTFTYDGEKYTFRPSTKYNFEANKLYTFNLNVGKDELTLDGCTILPWDADVETVVNGGEAEYFEDYKIVDGVYHVYSADGLKAWRLAVAGSGGSTIGCVLEEDIKMPTPTGDNGNWTVIDNYTGVFDGNGHTISNLVVKGEGTQGFIGILDGGTVKNLTLKNPQVYSTGQNGVGAVVGYITDNATIEYCQVIGGSVESEKAHVGGLVGIIDSGTLNITACSASCRLSDSSNGEIGGLVGYISGSTLTIKSSWTNCTFTGGEHVGGIVGEIYSGTTFSSSNVWWASADSNLEAIGHRFNATVEGTIQKVDGTDGKTWSAATNDMNSGLPADAPYKWQQNDGENNPPVLVKQ